MNRRAFTLVEILVTVAIIGILIGFAIPAVQRIRAAAAKADCASRMRQLGLAMHMYHDDMERLPPGSDTRGLNRTGWPIHMLPYIEQGNVYASVSSASSNDIAQFHNPAFYSIFGTQIKTFVCPADPRIQTPKQVLLGILGQRRTPDTDRITGTSTAFLSYLGVNGTERYKNDGMLYPYSATRLLDVLDGTSNTLLLGERPPSYDLNVSWWYAGYGDDGKGTLEYVMGVTEVKLPASLPYRCKRGTYYYGPGTFDGRCDAWHFWSPHIGEGANFVYVDGSVHFIPYTAVNLMPALATRAGGEVVDTNW